MYDVLISGFYGFFNSGDDAILLGMTEELRKLQPHLKIAVLSKNPKNTEENYGVTAVPRFNLFRIIAVMRKTKLFISGGGSLIQDVTSTRSLLYYLGLIQLAQFLGVRVMLYANGIGPVSTNKNRRLCKKILDKVELITLREPMSKDELEQMGITSPKIEVTADPAMTLEEVNGIRAKELLDQVGVNPEKPLITLSVRPWGDQIEHYTQALAHAADTMAQRYGAQILLIPLQLSQDLAICQMVKNKMKAPSLLLDKQYHIKELLAIIKQSDILIGMRLHALIYAVSMCVPVIGIVYDPKVDGLIQYVEQYSAGRVEELSEEKLLNVVAEVWKNREILEQDLKIKKETFEELARKNTYEVMRLIKD